MAVAMLLPLSLGHFGVGLEPLCWESLLSQWFPCSFGQFHFWGVCWKQPAIALSLFDVFVS